METNESKNKASSKHTFPVAPGVWGLKTIFVNLYFISDQDGSWVLVDAGVYGSTGKILAAAEELFGKFSRPKAIILTHGHFDHIGAVKELALKWEAPVYAHPMELPYLTGRSSYPPPDPSVGGGGMAYMSFLYPKKPIDITESVELLPQNGSVPGMPDWKWVHTPGHTPGHVSLFRESDRVLVAGDAFVTREGESVFAVITQKREVHGPPMYFTPDWASAHHSVEKLANLEPHVAATGHGLPMRGRELTSQLEDLVKNFWSVAVPQHGRYVHEPAVSDEQGVISVPPEVDNIVPKVLAVAGVVAFAGVALYALRNRETETYNGQSGSSQKLNRERKRFNTDRPISHNRPTTGFPPTIDPNYDDPTTHTNNYP